ncbi:cold-shock protein [Endozoicomonas sp. 4G]|uniref:cold-shock protein n=1 Tax=Endozoicomonas sp. 4G TaxID=2872754 RepID=UPI0023EF25BC|nr:cold-shock protein [Endozoicomonas sp. 4G]
MKHLKFIHMILGILSLTALIVEGSILNVLLEGALATASATMLLLTAALIHLCLGCYLTVYRSGKLYVQALASVMVIAGTGLSGWAMFSHQSPEIASSLLLVTGVLLHVVINLKSLNPATPMEVMDSGRETGTVKWFNVSKGFGFITRDNGEDVFVHYRTIRGEGHRTLTEGQRVEFIVIEKDKGLQAEDVIAAPRGR